MKSIWHSGIQSRRKKNCQDGRFHSGNIAIKNDFNTKRLCPAQFVQAKIKLLLSAKTPHVVSEVWGWSVCTALTSPQTRGWCTIWSTASQSRCFPLQASRCLHTPHRQRSGTSLHWCPHTGRSSASRHDHRLCYTAGKVFSDWLCWFSSRKLKELFQSKGENCNHGSRQLSVVINFKLLQNTDYNRFSIYNREKQQILKFQMLDWKSFGDFCLKNYLNNNLLSKYLLIFSQSTNQLITQKHCEKASPSPTLGSASEEHSLSPHRGGWPAACSPQSTGSQEPRDPPEPYSTHDAPSSPGRTTPSTATTRVKGQNGWFTIKRRHYCCHHRLLFVHVTKLRVTP